MRARTFFYVCAGIFLLALAYQLGARSAVAQSGSTIEAAAASSFEGPEVVINRYLWRTGGTLAEPPVTLDCTVPVPGSSPVVGCGGHWVILADGSFYYSNGTSWTPVGRFPVGGPTAQGQLRARYR